MIATVIIRDIRAILNDQSSETYTLPEIIAAINDAQRAICLYRPDANSSTSTIPLVLGSKQSIPSTARRLIALVRNMNSADDSVDSGIAIRKSVSMSDLDIINPEWHNYKRDYVTEYTYDETRPTEFYVYPSPRRLPQYVEIKTSNHPVDVVLETDNTSVNDIYSPCLTSWSVYRLLSADNEHSPSTERCIEHRNTFFKLLNIKTEADVLLHS